MSGSGTIFALASGRLPAGVAIVRLSGPGVRFGLETLFGRVPPVRRAVFGKISDQSGAILDHGLCLFFSGPASFTGEDVAEFHLHGGPAVVRAFLSVLGALPGFRHAEPGEFTRRGFLNGKLDLTQAEGLGELVTAESEAQRRWALLQSEGGLKCLYDRWRGEVIRLRAMVEAWIDFSEEDDVAQNGAVGLSAEIAALAAEMETHLSRARQAEIIRDGFSVVVLGAPNAGKSSLVNALAGREVAIISEEPGTTRDLIDVRLQINGDLVVLTDTAGLRAEAGSIEKIGIERARRRAGRADLVLLLEDMTNTAAVDLAGIDGPVIRVGTKSDLPDTNGGHYDAEISCLSGDGLDRLLEIIGERVAVSSSGSWLMPGSERQVSELSECVAFLRRALSPGIQIDRLAEDLRIASVHIGRLTGDVDVEDLLDVIFSKFCIGK